MAIRAVRRVLTRFEAGLSLVDFMSSRTKGEEWKHGTASTDISNAANAMDEEDSAIRVLQTASP